jgi:hypothetical protein
MLFRTLGEMRSELARRLGFGAQGSSGINSGLLDSFLQSAQDQLWWQFDWRHLITYDEKITEAGSVAYDWATDCDPTRITSLAIWDGVRWVPMDEGIDWAMRSTVDSRTIPARYERFAQMEIWPEPDDAYTVRRYYVRSCDAFTQDAHRASLDDALIFLHALTNAKAHYRQPDSQGYATQLEAMLTRLKGKSRGQAVVRRGGDASPVPRPRDV